METVYHVTLFGLEMDINPVAFKLPFGENGWPVYWYGIIIAAGFLLALIYCLKRSKSFGINNDRLIDAVLVTTPCAILGARAYYLLFDDGNLDFFKDFFQIHDGGLAIYGGVITAALVGALMCKIRKLKISDVLDLASLGFLIGQAIGRWGNFVNQEAFGRYIAADSRLPEWWGMTSEKVAAYYREGVMVHPCFLYESLWCILGFVLLHILSKHRKFSGQIALGYGIWYGIGRFFIEGLRTDSLYIGNVRVSQLVSAVIVVLCIILMIVIFVRKKYKDTPKDAEYEQMFGDVAAGTEDEEYTPVFGDVFGEAADGKETDSAAEEAAEETDTGSEVRDEETDAECEKGFEDPGEAESVTGATPETDEEAYGESVGSDDENPENEAEE